MDLLDACRRRNPRLIEAAAALHREGAIPPDTYVADLDAIRENATELAAALERHGLLAYFEAKQFGRNPVICAALGEVGFTDAIALDVEEAVALHDQGVRVGHVGHLGQPARADIAWVVSELQPAVVTVYSTELAAEIAKAASAVNRVQDVLLRVLGRDDVYGDLTGGGTKEEELIPTARAIGRLAGLRVVGVTSYPVLRYDIRERRYAPTPNLATLMRAREALEHAGIDVHQVNAAGNACVATAAQLASAGATHVEPGQALVGATPGHFFEDLTERPALVYVSEVAYADDDHAYAFASGMVCNATIGIWNALFYDRIMACVGTEPATLADRCLWAQPQHYAHSDPSAFMYARIRQGRELRADVGDTVVCGFRTQLYRANNARLAVVEGVSSGAARLVGLFDRTGRPVATHSLREPAPR
jgi:predicted amino acid racemase